MPNIGKHSKSIFVESEGNLILKKVLSSNKRISCFFSENDKTPNTDGFFELINDEGVPIKRFNVQIKTTSDLINGKYSLDTKILNYVFSKISIDPTFLFIVDLKSENIFYRYISMEYLLSIDFDQKKRLTLDFSKDKAFDCSYLEKELLRISEEHNRLILSKNKEDITEIQEGIRYLNDTIFSIPLLVDTLLPNLYRIGIASSNIEKVMTFKSPNKEDNVFKSVINYGAYFIFKGDKRFEIEDFKNESRYNNVLYDGTGETTPTKYAEGVVSNLVKVFFNNTSNYIRYLPTIVLNEIIFAFLDKLGSRFESLSSEKYHKTYFKDSVDVSESNLHIKKVIKYMWHILNSQSNLTQNELNLRNLLYRSLNSMYYQNGIDFIEMAATFCPNNRYELIDFDYELSSEQEKHMLSYLTNEYKLCYYAILEMNVRNISRVDRLWKFEPPKDVVYSGWKSNLFDERFFLQCKDWLTNLPSLYNSFTHNIGIKDFEIRKKITYSIVRSASSFPGIIAEFFSQSNDNFEIDVVEQLEKDVIHKYDNSGWTALIPEIMESKLPYYYSLTGLVYQMLCKKYSFENKGILVGSMWVKEIL